METPAQTVGLSLKIRAVYEWLIIQEGTGNVNGGNQHRLIFVPVKTGASVRDLNRLKDQQGYRLGQSRQKQKLFALSDKLS